MRRVTVLLIAAAMLAAGCSSGASDTTTTADEAVSITTTSTVTTTVPVPTTAASPVTLLPMGDAHTHGSTGSATYRCYLDALLTDAGIPFDFVGTRSEPYGGGPYGCETEFDQDHESERYVTIARLAEFSIPSVEVLQPDVALVLTGGFELAVAVGGGDAARVAGDLESFIADLQAASPDLTVLIAQPMPCNMPVPKCGDPYTDLYDLIASFDSRLSTNESSVVVVDLATGFSPDHFRDSLYLNDAGDRLVAERWMIALQKSGVLASSG